MITVLPIKIESKKKPEEVRLSLETEQGFLMNSAGPNGPRFHGMTR